METLPKNPVFEFHENTLYDVRKEYDLHQPGRMDQAIDILEQWIQKQAHLVKKDFPREYLERLIVNRKGSVERVKSQIDKLCTFKTLLPQYFLKSYSRTTFSHINILCDAMMPQLTDDHYRIYVLRVHSNVTMQNLSDHYKYMMLQWEYLTAFDYSKGVIALIDYTQVNVMDLLKILNIVEMRHVVGITMDGYGTRMKGLHIVTPSKAVDTIVLMLKQVMSAKIGSRIQVHSNIEQLYEHMPKKLLPKEYGGEKKSIYELHEKMVDTYCSKEFTHYAIQMNKACTDESLRQTDKFNERYMGTPGSFRALHVD